MPECNFCGATLQTSVLAIAQSGQAICLDCAKRVVVELEDRKRLLSSRLEEDLTQHRANTCGMEDFVRLAEAGKELTFGSVEYWRWYAEGLRCLRASSTLRELYNAYRSTAEPKRRLPLLALLVERCFTKQDGRVRQQRQILCRAAHICRQP